MCKRCYYFAFVLFLLLAALTSAMEKKVGYLGDYRGTWKKYLTDLNLQNEEIVVKGRLPVEEFKKYQIVILGQSNWVDFGPLDSKQSELIGQYVEGGGNLIITGGMPFKLAGGRDISAFDWLGARNYIYGRDDSIKIRETGSIITKHLDPNFQYEWFNNQCGLTNISTGANIIGSDKIARVMVNQYGKGHVLYLADVIGAHYNKESKGSEGYLGIIKAYLNFIFQD